MKGEQILETELGKPHSQESEEVVCEELWVSGNRELANGANLVVAETRQQQCQLSFSKAT